MPLFNFNEGSTISLTIKFADPKVSDKISHEWKKLKIPSNEKRIIATLPTNVNEKFRLIIGKKINHDTLTNNVDLMKKFISNAEHSHICKQIEVILRVVNNATLTNEFKLMNANFPTLPSGKKDDSKNDDKSENKDVIIEKVSDLASDSVDGPTNKNSDTKVENGEKSTCWNKLISMDKKKDSNEPSEMDKIKDDLQMALASIKSLEGAMFELNQKVSEMEKELNEKDVIIKEKDETIEELNMRLQTSSSYASELKSQNADMTEHIKKCETEAKEEAERHGNAIEKMVKEIDRLRAESKTEQSSNDEDDEDFSVDSLSGFASYLDSIVSMSKDSDVGLPFGNDYVIFTTTIPTTKFHGGVYHIDALVNIVYFRLINEKKCVLVLSSGSSGLYKLIDI